MTPVLDVMAVERKLFLASAFNLNHIVYFVSKHGIIFLMMMLEKLIKLATFQNCDGNILKCPEFVPVQFKLIIHRLLGSGTEF